MNGFVLAVAPCATCGNSFSFNPNAVPSIRIEGKRFPVCQTCMNRANARRKLLGLPPHPIMPEAYAPLPEEDLAFNRGDPPCA